MKKAIIPVLVLALSLVSAPHSFSQTRKKPAAKPAAKPSAKKAQPAAKTQKGKQTASKNQRDGRGARNDRNARDSRNSRNSREARNATSRRNDRNARDSRNSRNSRDTRNATGRRNDRNARDSRNSRNSRDTRNAASSRTSRDSRNSRPAKASRQREVAPRPSTVGVRAPEPVAARPKSAPKTKVSSFNRELIVNRPVAPIHANASADARYVANARLGTSLFGNGRDGLWYRVQYTVNGRTSSGWVQASDVNEIDGPDRNAVYRKVVERNPESTLDFVGAVAMYDFLTRVSGESQEEGRDAELELKKVSALRRAVEGIDPEDRNVSPYIDFIREHEGDVLYNDATGRFVVSSNLFWTVAEKYKGHSAGDDMAWAAARNPLPGSCGQSLSCHVFNLRMTDGEYLALHPNGRRSAEALRNISATLQPIIADLTERSLFKLVADKESKDELHSLVTELKTIVSRSGASEKAAVVGQLSQIASAYR